MQLEIRRERNGGGGGGVQGWNIPLVSVSESNRPPSTDQAWHSETLAGFTHSKGTVKQKIWQGPDGLKDLME